MSHQEEEGGVWPFKSESKGFNLFNKRASQSNDYGQLFEATFNDYKQLRDMNVAVSFANITKVTFIYWYFKREREREIGRSIVESK